MGGLLVSDTPILWYTNITGVGGGFRKGEGITHQATPVQGPVAVNWDMTSSSGCGIQG